MTGAVDVTPPSQELTLQVAGWDVLMADGAPL
jgi:hypothetical protein